MADDHADGSVVHGVGEVHAEGRRLQDAGGKDDFVHQRVVVGVGGGRGHAPAAAVDGLADLGPVIGNHKSRAGDEVFEVVVAVDLDARNNPSTCRDSRS